jgi:ethanolamine-phosphate phospho-lyase
MQLLAMPCSSLPGAPGYCSHPGTGSCFFVTSWMELLSSLKKDFPFLGDVRGAGLFIGVECIDGNKKENTQLAQQVKEGLKEAYILASTDGPLDNTLKMKPPLCFTKENADQFVEELYKILRNKK